MLAAGGANAFASSDKEVAHDTFVGTATTGGPGSPITINPSDIAPCSIGGIGIGYIYQANGPATGDIKGTFVYNEHGYLCFTNPADPTTFVGSLFKSGVFTLTSKKGKTYTIADTKPAAYKSGVKSVDPDKGFAAHIAKLLRKDVGLLPTGDTLTYGYFTFTDNVGTFTGYSTPDSSKFLITVGFTVPDKSKDS